MIIAGNQQLAKNINRAAIFHRIRTMPGLSRAELADALMLSRSAVGKLVEELIEEGWLTESGTVASTTAGRRPTPLQLEKSRKLLLGTRIDGERSEVLAVSLAGDVRELSICNATESPDVVLDILAGQIRDMHARLAAAGCQIAGIGLAVPGPVRPGSGILHHSDRTGWKELPVQDMLQQRLRAMGLPEFVLVVERALACIALKHFEDEHITDPGPMLYAHVGGGFSAVVVSGGEIVRGSRGLAGSCGHLIVEPDGLLCDCGQRGCANAVLTLRAMEEQLGMDATTIRLRAAAGDAATIAVMRATGAKLGSFLFNLSLQHDPARIFVGGPALQVGSNFVDAAQERMNMLSASASASPVELQVMRHERLNCSLGAATAVLQTLLMTDAG